MLARQNRRRIAARIWKSKWRNLEKRTEHKRMLASYLIAEHGALPGNQAEIKALNIKLKAASAAIISA